MKIMISSDGPHAHYHIRMAWAKVFSAMGYEVILWDIFKKPAFDAFDEFDNLFSDKPTDVFVSLDTLLKDNTRKRGRE